MNRRRRNAARKRREFRIEERERLLAHEKNRRARQYAEILYRPIKFIGGPIHGETKMVDPDLEVYQVEIAPILPQCEWFSESPIPRNLEFKKAYYRKAWYKFWDGARPFFIFSEIEPERVSFSMGGCPKIYGSPFLNGRPM